MNSLAKLASSVDIFAPSKALFIAAAGTFFNNWIALICPLVKSINSGAPPDTGNNVFPSFFNSYVRPFIKIFFPLFVNTPKL